MNQPASTPIARHLREPYLVVQTPKTIPQSRISAREIRRPRTGPGLSEKVARALFGDAPDLRSPGERRRAWLLAVLNALAGVPMLVAAIHLGIVDPRPERGGIAGLLAAGATWALSAYALARSGQLRLATGLTIALLWLAPAAYLGIEAHDGRAVETWTAAWLAISIVVAGALARPAAIVVATSSAIVVPAAVGGGGPPATALAPSAFLALVGGIMFLTACHRENVEADQAAAIAAKNAKLVAEGTAQKRRIEARAAELRRAHDELDRAQRLLSDQKRALSRSEAIQSLTRETAEVVHETMTPIGAVLQALSEAQALADEHARMLDDPDTTDADHRANAERMERLLDRAKLAAERSAALVHSADVELHLADKGQSEAVKRVPS